MTYAFIKYWVEGTKEAAHQLYDAIIAGDGWAEKSIQNLGLNTEEYETGRVEWCNPAVEDKEECSVLYFEEYYPYERGTLIDQLMDEDMFADRLTGLYYYAEEPANADLYETNDAEGKYFPNRLAICIEKDDDYQWLYCKDEASAIAELHEKCDIPEELTSLEDIKKYVDGKSRSEEGLWVTEIDVV